MPVKRPRRRAMRAPRICAVCSLVIPTGVKASRWGALSTHKECKPARRHKYGAVAVEVDGIKFDSKAEARRYGELAMLERTGAIAHLKVHPRYELQRSFTDRDGVKHRAIYYEADFEYERGQDFVVEDVKGHETKEYLIKKKMFLYHYPDFVYLVIKA
jgi:hypothetical protein